MSHERASAERQLVVFRLHGEQYGVAIETVREIVHYTRPTATAAATGLIRGLISLRGEVLPVADISERLGREPHSGEGAQIVVLALTEGSLGLIVDHVEGVRRVAGEQISPSPVPGTERGFGDEIAAVDDVLVLLLDPQLVLGGILRRPAPPEPKPRATRKPATRKPAARKPAARKPATTAKAASKSKAAPKSKPTPKPKPKPTTPAKPRATRSRTTRRPPAA